LDSITVTVCIDVDGTLLEYDEYEFRKFGKPKPGARSFLARQKAKGRRVTVFTTRADIEHEALISHLAQY
jgi:hydroxymethylpyrimidine pyrophosphatase-like HAD family hydrolase